MGKGEGERVRLQRRCRPRGLAPSGPQRGMWVSFLCYEKAIQEFQGKPGIFDNFPNKGWLGLGKELEMMTIGWLHNPL